MSSVCPLAVRKEWALDTRSDPHVTEAATPPRLNDRLAALVLRRFFLVCLGGVLGWFVACTWHWPLMQDSAVMHYVLFLMDHGFRPYHEITDNNLPGSYILERCAVLLFGHSDLGWRLYDLFLSGVLMASLAVIAAPYDWLAGVFAAGLFALRHGTDGIWFVAEREQEMAVLLAAACAFLFLAVRRRSPWLTTAFGLLSGMAVSVKPTLAPFAVLAMLLQAFELRRDKPRMLRALGWGLAGFALAVLVNVLFLVHFDAMEAFLRVSRLVTPVYARLNNPGLKYLILYAVPHDLLFYLLLVPVVAFARRRQWNWEHTVLLLGAIFGAASYFLQRKGFPYHRYIFLVFALQLAGMELLPAMRERQWWRWLGYAGLVYATIVVLPRDAFAIRRLPGSSPMQQAMQKDLEHLGGSRLQGQVQCFDMILGCLDSLYQLRLVENTGFTGDMLLFSAHSNPATAFYENLYSRLQAEHPANVLVVTNEEFGGPPSFRRLDFWPAFAENLAEHYTLAVTRTFPREGKLLTDASAPPEGALAYRIYLRKGVRFPPIPVSSGAVSP